MDSELPPPTKRLRAALNNKVQLAECIREFNLPRQYPSMVRKSNNETSNDKIKRQTFNTDIVTIPKAIIGSKIVKPKELPVTSKVRTIKLKGKDGRDLGEVNVQDLPHNIQGKTITIAKNGIKNPMEVIPGTDKAKGITIGVLTPINLLKSNEVIHCPPEKDLLPVVCHSKVQKDRIIDITKEKDVPKNSDTKKIPEVTTGMDAQGRPQVLVFQSGKNWHMIKIPNTSSKDLSQAAPNPKNIVIGRVPQAVPSGKVTAIQVLKEPQNQNVSTVGSVQNDTGSTHVLMNKSSTRNIPNKMIVRHWSQPRPIDITDRCKSKSPISADSSESTRPKIEISRIFGSSNKPLSTIQTRPNNEISKLVTRSPLSMQKNLNLNKDVMVVLPSAKENNAICNVVLNNEESITMNSELMESISVPTVPVAPVTAAQGTSGGSTWRRKLLASKNIDAAKYSSSRDITSVRQMEKKIMDNGEKKYEFTNNLSILEKALSTVEDEVLRAKALKALAECGIGIERLVPIRPALEQRPVKDSGTQTSVFGLWDPEEFIYVPKDSPGIQRKRLIERAPSQSPNNIIGNPNSQELFLNNLDIPNWVSTDCVELTNMVEGYVKGNEVAAKVADIFSKPSPVRPEVVEQLEKDFDTYKKHDENGLLSIHKAVVADDVQAVTRLLFVIRASEESVDLPTRDGQTSLELAVRYDVSPKIVKLLLDSGAQPTSADTAHDSALIIASRQSYPILMDLIPYVETRMALDNYDSTGFAALHYCAQNGYQEGVTALTRASANVNLRDRRSGRTPLFHAIENDHNELARMLLKNGAEPSVPNYGGQTIFNVIDEGKHYNLLEALNRITNK